MCLAKNRIANEFNNLTGTCAVRSIDANDAFQTVFSLLSILRYGMKDLLVGDGDGYLNLFLNEGTDDAPIFSSVNSFL